MPNTTATKLFNFYFVIDRRGRHNEPCWPAPAPLDEKMIRSMGWVGPNNLLSSIKRVEDHPCYQAGMKLAVGESIGVMGVYRLERTK